MQNVSMSVTFDANLLIHHLSQICGVHKNTQKIYHLSLKHSINFLVAAAEPQLCKIVVWCGQFTLHFLTMVIIMTIIGMR